MDVEAPRGLLRFFDEIEDPRKDRTRLHLLSDILVITLCGVICGANNWVEIEMFGNMKLPWLRAFLVLPNGFHHFPGEILRTFTTFRKMP